MLRADDGAETFATFAPARDGNDRAVLLFHQARSNRHEYDPLIAGFHALHFDTLAIDQRSGGDLFAHANETVVALGKSTAYMEARPDLEEALAWAVDHPYRCVVAVGSSYSAALVFFLANGFKGQLQGIAAFSPGEYLGRSVRDQAETLSLPIYVTAPAKEQDKIDEVLAKHSGKNVTRHRPENSVHGASTLRADKNPRGAQVGWDHFASWLSSICPEQPR